MLYTKFNILDDDRAMSVKRFSFSECDNICPTDNDIYILVKPRGDGILILELCLLE